MPKVLIVDDEEDILWGLSEELSRNGIDVDTASNGQEAFEKIKENDYDFLITDIRMPGMSGSELLLKSKNLRPDLKVVVMTAYGSDELKQEVLSHGAISYLEKPFDFEQLLELIKEKGKKVDETISKLSLNQFMQLVSMEGQSCTVTVKTDEGEGKVYFIDGEVVNAEFQNFTGEDAFIKIMKFQHPAFDVDWGVPQTKRMIEKPLHALLLAAVAKKEEEEAGVAPGGEGEEINEEEVDLSALSELFGEDEGVAEESKEEEVVEEAPEESGKEGAAKEEEGMELDLESLSFGEDEVVEEEAPEPSAEANEEAPEEVKEEVPEEEEEFSIENIESMLGEEIEEGAEKQPAKEAVEEAPQEEEAKEEVPEEEEFSLENLESMLEEEVEEESPAQKEEVEEESPEKAEEGTEEQPAEEVGEVAEEEAVEENVPEEEVSEVEGAPEEAGEAIEEQPAEEAEELAEEERVEENAPGEEVVEEGVPEEAEKVEEGAEEGEEAPAEEEIVEKQPAEEVAGEETPQEEEVASVEEAVEKASPSRGAPVIAEDKIPVVEEVLRKIVALTTDIHAGFIADINGNLVASQFRSGGVKGDDLGYLGEYIGMISEVLKQVTGEDIEDITISLKNENVIAAPALGGNIGIFIATTKRTMKLALIKVELKKAVAKLNEELS